MHRMATPVIRMICILHPGGPDGGRRAGGGRRGRLHRLYLKRIVNETNVESCKDVVYYLFRLSSIFRL